MTMDMSNMFGMSGAAAYAQMGASDMQSMQSFYANMNAGNFQANAFSQANGLGSLAPINGTYSGFSPLPSGITSVTGTAGTAGTTGAAAAAGAAGMTAMPGMVAMDVSTGSFDSFINSITSSIGNNTKTFEEGSSASIASNMLSGYFTGLGMSAEQANALTSFYGDAFSQLDAMGANFSDMISGTSGSTSASENDMSKMLKDYFKKTFPNMSDSELDSLVKTYSSQYGEYAKMGDMSSLISMVNGAGSVGSAGEAAGTSGASNNRQYAKKAGVDGMLKDAGSMVGLHEKTNTAAINKVTKESGINCATTPWCAAFAMNMLKDHGVLDVSGCSNINYCPTIKNWAQKENIWAKSASHGGSYTPQAGDAILFDWNGDGTAQHIGIVEKVVNGKVYTIEGNSSDSVKRNSYSLSSSKVMGYINCGAQK